MSRAGLAASAPLTARIRLPRAALAVVAIAALLSAWILAVGRRDYPSLHIILDTAIFILSLLLTFFLADSRERQGPPIAVWLSISFGIVAILALLHVAVSVDWFGVLSPVSDAASFLRPATWPPAVHALPVGVALAISPWCRPRLQGWFAIGLALFSLACVYIFTILPRYSPPVWLGISRPSLIFPPLLWTAVALACWKRRERSRLIAPLAVMGGILALANFAMLYSRAPHDSVAMVAHFGRIAGFLVLLTCQMNLAAGDLGARLAAEQELAMLNRELEQRVHHRTAQLEESGRQLHTEAAIRHAAEERFRAVVESAPSGMIMIDGQGRISLVNREVERLFGYDRAQLLGKPIEALIPQRFRGGHEAFRGAFMRAPNARAMGAGRDLFGLRQDGSEVPVEIGLNPIQTAEGSYVLASVVDISARKLAEAELLRSNTELRQANREARFNNARLHIAVNHLPLTLYQTDLDLRYTWIISPPEVLDADRIIGLTDEQIVPPEAARQSMDLKRKVLERGEGVREELILSMNGTRTVFDLIIEPLRDDEGRMIGLTGAAFDVTARKQVEDELRRSNEELERFAYVASHDLQEPLRMVGSYVQLLAKRYQGKLDQDADDFIGFAVDGAMRMQGLIEDLLAFSRVGSRGGALVPVEMGEVLARVLRDLQLSIEQAGARVTWEPLPLVEADETQLHQILLNLISNAIKFRGVAAPKIHLSAKEQGSVWQVSVADNGIGIEPQYFERIFVLFQRLHTREQYSGTGIGLAIARKIVERHGGRIWVESEPGHGTTFHFTLRAVQTIP